jgi:hypothetical protein
MTAVDAVRRAITVALGFVRERTPESSTRLVMILFGVTASVLGLGTLAYAFVRDHEVHQVELLSAQLVAQGKPALAAPDNGVTMIVALVGLVTLFIGSGAVAIALRTRKGGEPGDPTDGTTPVVAAPGGAV